MAKCGQSEGLESQREKGAHTVNRQTSGLIFISGQRRPPAEVISKTLSDRLWSPPIQPDLGLMQLGSRAALIIN